MIQKKLLSLSLVFFVFMMSFYAFPTNTSAEGSVNPEIRVTPTATPSTTFTGTPPTMPPPYTHIPIRIVPDFTVKDATAPLVLAGFKVKFTRHKDQIFPAGFVGEHTTDEKGFVWAHIPLGIYDIEISKPNYLTKTVKEVSLYGGISLGTPEDPMVLWAGDIMRDGAQDQAINMADIMEIVKSFNTVKGQEKYNAHCDLNMDDAINMSDIMIVVRHFNSSPADYPASLPTVGITSPKAMDWVTVGEEVEIHAEANDADGEVKLVEFYTGQGKIGEDATPPYTCYWKVPDPLSKKAGTSLPYWVRASVTDNYGLRSNSAVVELQVDVPTPTPTPLWDSMVFDNSNRCYSERGRWSTKEEGNGGSLRYSSTYGGTATWTVTIPKTRYYEISALYPPTEDCTDIAKYTVKVNGEIKEVLYKNQQRGEGFLQGLFYPNSSIYRQHYLNQGDVVEVILEVTSDGEHRADAIKFEGLSEDPTPTPTPPDVPPCGYSVPKSISAVETVVDDRVQKHPTYISSCDDGEYVVVPDVVLSAYCGGIPLNRFSAIARVSRLNEGRQVEIRVDSPEGPLIGTLTLKYTEHLGQGFYEQNTHLYNVNSEFTSKDVYLVFKGGQDIAQFQHFRLTRDSGEYPPVNTPIPTPTPTSTPTPTPVWDSIILDNGEDSYSETGTWYTRNEGNGGSSRYSTEYGSTASWTVTVPETENYEIRVLYPPNVANTDTASYTVEVNGQLEERYFKDQKRGEGFLQDWYYEKPSMYFRHLLRKGDVLKVTLTVQSQGNHVADAIKVEGFSPNATPTGTPPIIIPGGYGQPKSIQAVNAVFDESIEKQATYISGCDGGEYVMIPDVVLSGSGGLKALNLFTAKVRVMAGQEGKQVEIRMDSSDGPLLGMLTLMETAHMGAGFYPQTARLHNVNSNMRPKNVYLVFKGGTDIADFKSFSLNGVYGEGLVVNPTPAPIVTPTPTPTLTSTPTVTPTPTPTQGQQDVWIPNTLYHANDRVTYAGAVYRCIQEHTSLAGWEPNTAPSLWVQVTGS